MCKVQATSLFCAVISNACHRWPDQATLIKFCSVCWSFQTLINSSRAPDHSGKFRYTAWDRHFWSKNRSLGAPFDLCVIKNDRIESKTVKNNRQKERCLINTSLFRFEMPQSFIFKHKNEKSISQPRVTYLHFASHSQQSIRPIKQSWIVFFFSFLLLKQNISFARCQSQKIIMRIIIVYSGLVSEAHLYFMSIWDSSRSSFWC